MQVVPETDHERSEILISDGAKDTFPGPRARFSRVRVPPVDRISPPKDIKTSLGRTHTNAQ